jgi:hypothetical protein
MAIQAIGNGTGTVAEVDTTSRTLRIDKEQEAWGVYSKKLTSGTMAAGLAANSNVYHFRNTSPRVLCLIKGVKISAGATATAFAAGICTFRLFPARFMTTGSATATSGSFQSVQGKLRTASPASQLGTVRMAASTTTFVSGWIVIASTAAPALANATLDTDPIAAFTRSVAGVAGEVICNATRLLNFSPGRYPLICPEWEGFAIQATVPATGTWSFAVTVEWEEAPLYS